MSMATETVERSEGRQGLASMIRRVKIRNYKSIKNCDVELGPFTILVGRNGSGKSNFLDAIRLVTEGLREPDLQWDFDLMPWSGVADRDIHSIIEDARISLEMDLGAGSVAIYEIVLSPQGSGFAVVREWLDVRDADGGHASYSREPDELVDASIQFMPPALPKRLYLGRASGVPQFRPVYDALTSSAFYNLNPEVMKEPEKTSHHPMLARDGSNVASIYDLTIPPKSTTRERLLAYLALVVPEFAAIRREDIGPYSTLIFDRAEGGPPGPKSFYAASVSDGTLRALGILVAINQLASDGQPIRLVGIEEPETALHPAAAGALMGALREAATHTQVLVTTHSADLLDRFDPDEGDHLLLATMSGGATHLTEIDPASKRIIRKHLDTAGGLLRMDQLEPDPADLARQNASTPSPGGNGDM